MLGRQVLKVLKWHQFVTGDSPNRDKLKKKWANLKAAAKKKASQLKADQRRTGGGPEEATPLDTATEYVLDVVKDTMFVLGNDFDCEEEASKDPIDPGLNNNDNDTTTNQLQPQEIDSDAEANNNSGEREAEEDWDHQYEPQSRRTKRSAGKSSIKVCLVAKLELKIS